MAEWKYEVVIVGAGPAGITAAIALARAEIPVLVLEAGAFPGAENWSGAVYFTENLAQPDVLGEEAIRQAAWERPVTQRGVHIYNGHGRLGLTYRNPKTFRHCYTVLRPTFDHYLAALARSFGATILTETTATGLVRDPAGKITGVQTTRGPVRANVVFLAEGDASHLVTKEGYERATEPGAPHFLQGIKEVVEMDPGEIERRFQLPRGEGAAYEIILRNPALRQRTARLNMGGFLYTNHSSISLGLVLPLDNLAREFHGDHNRLMEWFKSLPEIRHWIGDGRSAAYGTKIIRGGGYRELPQLTDDGLALGGACTGIGIDFPFPNFTGPATAMGQLFAQAVKQIRATDQNYSRQRLVELYEQPLRATHYFQNVEHLARWPHYVEHTRVFFGRFVDLKCGSLNILTHPGLHAGQKLWQLAKHLRETLPPKSWAEFVRDLRAQRRALGLSRPEGRSHQPGHPNVGAPFRARPAEGEVTLSFSVDGQPRDYPLFAKLAPALRAASDHLYRNDDTPLPAKLAAATRAARRDLPVSGYLALLGIITPAVLLMPVQWLCEMVWLLVTRPSPARYLSSFFQKTKALVRQRTNLDAVTVAQPWEEKLSLIRYVSEKTSHIKVIRPEHFEDRSQITGSSLWHVCPARVYECHTDDLGQPQLVVNFENCIKCESCWRAAPADVDWTRNREHRLIYSAPTPANEKLLKQLLVGAPLSPVGAPFRARPAASQVVGESRPEGRSHNHEHSPHHAALFLHELHTGPRYLDTQRRRWLLSLVERTGNARAIAHAKQNKFFWAAAELTPVAAGTRATPDTPPTARRLAVAELFPKQSLKALDHGERMSAEQLAFLQSLPADPATLRELAGVDLSLALLVSGVYSAQIKSRPELADVPWIGLHTARTHWRDFANRPVVADLRSIALSATEMLLERCRQHATTRVQFPGLFRDEDAHDGIIKFGAVKKLFSEMLAARHALAAQADVDAAELLRLVTYNAGQIIGGSAYSEDDIFAKYYRDAVCLSHFPAQNSPPQPKPVETEWDHELQQLIVGAPLRARPNEESRPQGRSHNTLGRLILEHGYIERPLTEPPAFSYREALRSEQHYDYGDFLVKPFDPRAWRFTPEMLHADAELRAYHARLHRYFTERFANRPGEKYHRLVERLHQVPLEDVQDMIAQGFTRMYIPPEFGGEGLLKAHYYILCPLSMRYADPSYALTIMAHTSIGTTPILLGLHQDLPRAKQDLQEFLANASLIPKLQSKIQSLLRMLDSPAVLKVKDAFVALGDEVKRDIGSKPMLRAVAAKFLAHFMDAGRAGLRLDLETFRSELQRALGALDEVRPNAEAVVAELDRRAAAAKLYLRWISHGAISAFALTEPSAGSDSGGIQTRAELKRVEVFTNPDGTKYFQLGNEQRRIVDLSRSDLSAPPDCDAAQIRREGDREFYEYYELNGAKMWITNGHVAGVFCLYARTKEGPTGFLVKRNSEGLVVGRDEEKMGQRGSPTNELSLTGVRVPRENIIGIEGRGQVNALETLNVGRMGLCVSAVAMMAKIIEQARAFARERNVDAAGILGEMAAELYAAESLAYELIGRADHHGTTSVRTESAIGKYYASEALHRCLRLAERVFGIEGATQLHELEKHRRDARVLNIYEGTNEVQRFLILRDLVDGALPKWNEADPTEPVELADAKNRLRRALRRAVDAFGAQVWQNPNFQPTMFKLAELAGYVKLLDAARWRTEWLRSVIRRDANSPGPVPESAPHRGAATPETIFHACSSSVTLHLQIAEECFAAYQAFAAAEMDRLHAEFERDFALLRQGLYPPEIRVAQLALWETPPAPAAPSKATGPAVVVMTVVPVVSPRPRVADGQLLETHFDFDAASWAALARTDGATVITVAPGYARPLLRRALAAGAAAAVLLETEELPADPHAVARWVADRIALHHLPCDRVWCGDPTLATVLRATLGGAPPVETVTDGAAPAAFTVADFIAAEDNPLTVIPARQIEAAPATQTRYVLPQADTGAVTRIEPTVPAAAAFVRQATGASGRGGAAPFSGPIAVASPAELPTREAAVFLATPAQLDGVGAAAACARELALPLHAVVLGDVPEREQRRIAAQLPAVSVWFVTHPRLPGNERLVLPRLWKDTLPAALLAGAWATGLLAQFAATFPRVQARYGVVAVADGELFVPVFGGKVQRAYRLANPREHPLVATFGRDEGGGIGDEPRCVFHVPLAIELPATVAEAATVARRGIGEADFIIDVGYAIRNRENFDAVIVPLKKRLEEIGVKNVTIGGTRKVVEELHLLEPGQQIGQTGTAVNPRIILAIGVSGAPQHVDYIGERATIIAFNKDPAAPLLTLNQRRPRPVVVPIVGDLFETVPQLTAALKP